MSNKVLLLSGSGHLPLEIYKACCAKELDCHVIGIKGDFTENNIQNQILKATINNLTKMDDIDKEYKAKLIHQRTRLADVSDIRINKTHFSGLRFNSNNRFYEFLLNVEEH